MNTEKSLLEKFLKLQDVAIFQFTYMGEQCFCLRVKGLIFLPDLQSILNEDLVEKIILFAGFCFPYVKNTNFKIALEEVLELILICCCVIQMKLT